MNPTIAAVFEGYSDETRKKLLQLRRIILDTASATAGVGPLAETLKWGQVSYLTDESGTGTTVRIDQDKKSGHPALYVSCKTDLLHRYRTIYPDSFEYEGQRGVIISSTPDETALRHMVAMALTYHQDKKKAR